jgi:hypothetical protein
MMRHPRNPKFKRTAKRRRRSMPATIGMLILGVTIGAVVGMANRPGRPPVFDAGFDHGEPQPAQPETDPARTGDDYHDSVANDDGWPRAR